MYVDLDKVMRLGMFQRCRITVRCNGAVVNKAASAKSGKNGFVEFYDSAPVMARDCIRINKMRGKVKISFSPI